MIPTTTYRYRADVLKVKDGDTIVVSVDLGFKVRIEQSLRVAGTNAPELHAKDAAERERAQAARDFVVEWVTRHPRVIVETMKDVDKYGRYLATVYGFDGENLGQLLVEAKHALPWDGKGARPT